MVANSEAAAWALEQAVTAAPPLLLALNFKVGEGHTPGQGGALGPPAGPGNTRLGFQNSVPSPRAQLSTRPTLARSPGVAHVMQKGDPPQPPPAGLCCSQVTGPPQPVEQVPPEPCTPLMPGLSPLNPTPSGSCGKPAWGLNQWRPGELRCSREKAEPGGRKGGTFDLRPSLGGRILWEPERPRACRGLSSPAWRGL